jgi:hypothetical protein
MVAAGLKDVRVEETSEEMKYRSGKDFWDWVTNSNPHRHRDEARLVSLRLLRHVRVGPGDADDAKPVA